MDFLAWVMLGMVAVATVGLVIYLKAYLPKQMEEKYRESLKAFSTAVELRFPSHEGLTQRVIGLSAALGEQLGLSRRRLADLENAALLRDIGLCAIPYKLVNSKPFMDWDEADRLTYMRHPEVSGAMLELIPSLRHLAAIVRSHHAPFDGSGGSFFPRGESIPLESRVLCVVCEYVWLESRLGDLMAKEAIRLGRGSKFDPVVVDQFLRMLTSASVADQQETALLL